MLKKLKYHASNLKDAILKDDEKKTEEKIFEELVNKCTDAHT